jgi:hypothetical protein
MADEKLVTEFDYALKAPFTYAFNGDDTEATFITLTAPTPKHARECAELKQGFFVAQRSLPDVSDDIELSEAAKEKKETGLNGDDVLVILAGCKDVDYPRLLEVARKLFTSGIAQVDGETKLTSPLVDKMSLDDFESMTGAFLANFTLASMLAPTKDSSESS